MASAEDAIRVWLSDYEITYAGPCEDITNPQQVIGHYCSAVVEDRGATVVAKIGPTSSEYSNFLLIQRTADGWRVDRAADIPPPDEDGGSEQPPF